MNIDKVKNKTIGNIIFDRTLIIKFNQSLFIGYSQFLMLEFIEPTYWPSVFPLFSLPSSSSPFFPSLLCLCVYTYEHIQRRVIVFEVQTRGKSHYIFLF